MEGRLAARLRRSGSVWAEEEARLLVDAAAGDPDRLEVLVGRREVGEPLEVVLGHADLGGVRVPVTTGVFVPRARSALLVRLAVAALAEPTPDPAGRRPADPPVVVDLCCGTGALGAAVAHARPEAEVWAVDIDPAAVGCARQVLPPERVLLGDLWAPLPDRLAGRVAVVLANAPYVPSHQVALLPPEARDHERIAALDGGTDGLDVQRRVAAGAPAWLAPGGVLVVETSQDQAAASSRLLADAGLAVRTRTDPTIAATAVVGTRRG